jgi:uncharacterized phiE125 gp8 family phage protein
MALRRIVAPAVEPLTLAEVKEHLRVDHDTSDSIIQAYIAAATSYVDGEFGVLGRALVTQTWELVIDHFPVHEIKIPLPPLQSVESIKYDDPDGFEQILGTDQYYVDDVSEPAWVIPIIGGWPTAVLEAINSVRIRYVAGYEATTDSPPDLAGNVPRAIKQAMLLHIGSFHEHREQNIVGLTTMQLPFAAQSLLRPWLAWIPFA